MKRLSIRVFKCYPMNDYSATSESLCYNIYSHNHSSINSLSTFLRSDQPMIAKLPHLESLFDCLLAPCFHFHKVNCLRLVMNDPSVYLCFRCKPWPGVIQYIRWSSSCRARSKFKKLIQSWQSYRIRKRV